jgi:glyoxylase-like metal-dependent hydrolase (beta-lactamase superfamily II)
VRTTKLSDHLFQITRFGAINAYLVREDDGFTLVDTTLGGAADGLITAAAQAGGQIKRIALTHGHLDHVGSLDALKNRLGSNVKVSMGELDARILAGEKVVEGRLPGSWPKVKTSPDTRLTGGETIGSLEVVPTPGHCPGHVAFRANRDGTVIAGDVFTSFGGRHRVQSLLLSVPVCGHGDLGPGEGLRVGPGHPSAEPEPACRRPWARDAPAGGGDRRGDHAGAALRPPPRRPRELGMFLCLARCPLCERYRGSRRCNAA